MSVCTIEGCEKPHLAKGYCSAHYNRVRKHGDPLRMDRAAHGAPLAFLDCALTGSTEDCVLWPFKSRYKKGYGSVFFRGKLTGAHRAMCILAHGEPPHGHEAAHSCGTRLCVNPRHLRWATPIGNAKDKSLHGTDTVGERNPQAKLTEDDVIQIRSMGRAGMSAPEIAAMFPVSRRAIGFVLRGETWRHVKEAA